MSLIGPRPERPEIDNLLIQKIPFYNFRYSIKPGLSGWAQSTIPMVHQLMIHQINLVMIYSI